MTEWKDYPSGDGRPDCPLCRGRGVVPLPVEERPPFAIGEITRICNCVLVRDVKNNMERGWKGLSKAAPIKKSPLLDKHKTNLHITSTMFNLKLHVRHVAARMGPRWNFVVISDATLMDAWLSKGLNVYDPDVAGMREDERRKLEKSPYEALSELVQNPALLVICLGVKAARNSAMPEVLLETLTLRGFDDKPTWIVDQSVYPLIDGHISYSVQVGNFIEDWECLSLDPKGVQKISMGKSSEVPINARPSIPVSSTRDRVKDEPSKDKKEMGLTDCDPDEEIKRMEEKDRKNKWKKGGKR